MIEFFHERAKKNSREENNQVIQKRHFIKFMTCQKPHPTDFPQKVAFRKGGKSRYFREI